MLGGECFQQRRAVFRLPAGFQVVAQLAHQHRGWQRRIVDLAAANPAHVELVAGGEQRFQKQVAVVFPAGAVAGAIVAAHQVEIQRRLGAGVLAVVHAQ